MSGRDEMTWLTDIGTYLQLNGIGTVGTDIFYKMFQSGVPNCISLLSSAGSSPKYTLPIQNSITLERPELRVLVKNTSPSVADAKAQAIEDLLSPKINTTIGSTRFKSIKKKAPHFFVSQSLTEGTIYSIYFSLEIG